MFSIENLKICALAIWYSLDILIQGSFIIVFVIIYLERLARYITELTKLELAVTIPITFVELTITTIILFAIFHRALLNLIINHPELYERKIRETRRLNNIENV